MFTSGVARSLRDASQAAETATRLGSQLTTGRKIQAPDDDPSTWLEAARSQSAAGLLDVIHTGLSEAATDIGIADTTMQAIGKHLDTMTGSLTGALEHPSGTPERDQAISDFNTTLQQIDQMVSTTAQAGARDLMSGGDLNVLTGLHGEQKTIHAQPVTASALNLSPLAATATDDEINAALANLTSAQATLSEKRQALATGGADINRYEAQGTQLSDFYQNTVDSLTNADSTEAASSCKV
jgi:flagellin-like hook-associated protein FlgL